jgi:hypothetical protein
MRTPSPPYCRLDLAPPLADRFILGVAPIDYGPVLLLMPFGFEHLTHLGAIEFLIGLRAGRPHGRLAAGVEQAELDAYGVDDLTHDAAQGVNFAHQVPLGDPTHSGIAGHLRDEIEIDRVKRGPQAHPRRSHGGLAAGVSRADYDYVVFFRKTRNHKWKPRPEGKRLF